MIMKSKKLSIKIITLFPQFVEHFAEAFGIVKRAVKLKLLDIKALNLRSFGLDQRQTVDGRPYGGGVGMVLRADVLYKAIKRASSSAKASADKKGIGLRAKTRVILLTPQGQKFNQKTAQRLANYNQLILVCGRYEGFDERIRNFVDEEISIGDYVLMGGELPALVVSEAVMRLRPRILGKDESTIDESFSDKTKSDGRQNLFLEYPQYTKPEKWKVESGKWKGKTLKVPKVLLTGHHKNIQDWRQAEAKKRTKKRRPDLIS
jgi:tRNA (guanine37-N1)-methyltransferase